MSHQISLIVRKVSKALSFNIKALRIKWEGDHWVMSLKDIQCKRITSSVSIQVWF